MGEFNIHDTVIVSKNRKDRAESYGDRKISLLITSIDEKSVTGRRPDSSVESIDINEDDRYERATIASFSEIEFKEEIKKEIEKKNEYIAREKEDLKEVLSWYDIYTSEISFFGKLINYTKREVWKSR